MSSNHTCDKCKTPIKADQNPIHFGFLFDENTDGWKEYCDKCKKLIYEFCGVKK